MPRGVCKPGRKGIWEKMKYDPVTGCWNWIGAVNSWGYGWTSHLGKRMAVHKLAAHLWLRYVLGSELQVQHHCDNPRCFNPKHLYIGNQIQNMQDRIKRHRNPQLKKTHCPKGHPFSGSNLCVLGNGWRECRVCRNERALRWFNKNKEAVNAKRRV